MSDDFFRAVVETAGEAILVTAAALDSPGPVIEYVNPHFARMSGYEPAELLGRSPRILQGPKTPRPMLDRLRAALTAGQPFEAEAVNYRKDGSEYIVSWLITPYRDDAGTIRHWISVQRDVTEQRRSEERLRQSEARFARAIAAAAMGTWDWDIATDHLHVSPGFEQLYGRPLGSHVDRPTIHKTIHPDDLATVMASSARVMRGEDDGRFVNEIRVMLPDGGTRWLRITGRAELDETGKPLRMAGVTQDVTERRSYEARVLYMARHDALTGLVNRNALQERLNDTLRRRGSAGSCAIQILDLDHFKEVNDTLGHPAGDQLLRLVAERLSRLVRERDIVSRHGGDEFVIVQTGLRRRDDAARLAERIIQEITEPYRIDGQTVYVGVSIGIAMGPGDGKDADYLLRCADLALYQAKQDGRLQYRFFEPAMQEKAQARRLLEVDLRQALAADEFELHYQPVVDIRTRHVTGFEALVRWRNETRGLVLPDAFIAHAEDTNIIEALGLWVLTRACTDARTWTEDRKVAVNLSSVQFTKGNLVQSLVHILQMTGLAPARLELEITERVLLQDTDDVLRVLHQIRQLGISIAMDDFGQGYSSLSYLVKFPFNKVKIDRSFVVAADEEGSGSAIIRAVAQLCDSLDITTTVEGVETQAQLDAMRRLGCREAQGYLFSPAVPLQDIPALIDAIQAV
ncbi:putative bifunctional diguanylate cyclase/phosphodiesterase [Acidisoma silvae]|uniref:EAL domain-containing protein n=1 Tax=Acidisoma silvae TaxID=2802396 RepID=A0A963YNA5_9PROT|nr:GGDEF domain-containing phosphodiesterase [Acidisoma silvae]MCB8873970.1 EAL domain-containing protein [Acidisoma silvae]